MLESPGQFVCDSASLKVGHRIHGLVADDELERRQLYFVLPMELLYSVLTREEMSSLTYKATRALKYNNFVKIFPVLSEFCIFPSDGKTMDSMAQNSSLWRGIPSKDHGSPPWKPLLKLLAVGGLDDDQRSCKKAKYDLVVGDYLFTPAGDVHRVKYFEDTEFFIKWEGKWDIFFDEEMEVAKSEISKEADDGFELVK
uniref:Uncharacterized protein n=1 Tax=Salix viminalis TaxID=40686 RepID=A0A6N2LY63_SALVM